MSSTDQGSRSNTVFIGDRGDTLHVRSGGAVEVESGASVDIESGGTLEFAGTALTFSAAEGNVLDVSVATEQPSRIAGVSFIEDGSGTSYTGAIVIPAGSLLIDIWFLSTVLWDGTSATLKVGDDEDDNGWFTGVDLKATNLLVGETLQMSNSEYWGGLQGAYLTAASGTRGTSGTKTTNYYATANTVTAVITPGAADGSAGRSFMWAEYATPVLVASTNV